MYSLAVGLLYACHNPGYPGTVVLAGDSRQGQNPPIKGMRSLDWFALVYLREGRGLFETPDEPALALEPGSCLLIPPRVPHRYRPLPGSPWSEVYFVFGGPVFQAWAQSGWLPGSYVFPLTPVNFWESEFRKALPSANQAQNCDEVALNLICGLQTLLAGITLFARSSRERPEDKQWLSRAKEALLSGAAEARSLEEAAEQVGLPYDAFRKRFMRLSGQGPQAFRESWRVDRASHLLLETDLALARIAEELGYCDAFHFSRNFKMRVGSSPAEFRRNNRA